VRVAAASQASRCNFVRVRIRPLVELIPPCGRCVMPRVRRVILRMTSWFACRRSVSTPRVSACRGIAFEPRHGCTRTTERWIGARCSIVDPSPIAGSHSVTCSCVASRSACESLATNDELQAGSRPTLGTLHGRNSTQRSQAVLMSHQNVHRKGIALVQPCITARTMHRDRSTLSTVRRSSDSE
jgi:hypothetical protein